MLNRSLLNARFLLDGFWSEKSGKLWRLPPGTELTPVARPMVSLQIATDKSDGREFLSSVVRVHEVLPGILTVR